MQEIRGKVISCNNARGKETIVHNSSSISSKECVKDNGHLHVDTIIFFHCRQFFFFTLTYSD